MYVRNSLNVMKEQIKTGHIQPTLDAISKFEDNEKSRGFGSAASGLWQDFATIQYKTNKEKTSNKEDDAPGQKPAR